MLAQRFSIMALLALAAPVAVPDDADAAFPGRNGPIVYTQGTNKLVTIRADGAGRRVIRAGKAWLSSPSYSPDGQSIALTASFPGAGSAPAASHIAVVSARGTDFRLLPRMADHAYGSNENNQPLARDGLAAWSPDGTSIVFSGQVGITLMGWFDKSIPPTYVHTASPDGRDVTRLTKGVDPTWSTRGSIAFVRHLFTEDPDWMPYGDYYGRFGGSFVPTIRTMAPDGSGLRHVAYAASRPTWSPDGLRLAFVRSRRDDEDQRTFSSLHVVRADGRGRRRIARGGIELVAWSPDGRKLAYVVRSFHGKVGTDAFVSRDTLHTIRPDGRGHRVVRRMKADHRVTGLDWQPLPRGR